LEPSGCLFDGKAMVTLNARDRVEQTYREQSARLLRAVFAYAQSREIAEDSVAEAFAQAVARSAEIQDVASWVWRTSFLLATRQLSDRRRGSNVLGERSYEMDEPATSLVASLRALSPKQRAAIVLHHYAGYSTKEIARMIDSTNGAVRVHLSVGRRRLRDIMEAPDG
jgi:RNA polymerase sigma-70 factor (ECF subfamily)